MSSPENPSKKRASHFPLWRHPTGQWAKKFRGRYYYFGTDKDEAERRYRAEWDGIKAGRPRPKPDPATTGGVVTVKYLCNAFLADRKGRVDAGELSPGSWRNYFQVCGTIMDVLGRSTPTASLRPADFGRLRAHFAAKLGPNTVGLRLMLCRGVFKFGTDLTGRPPDYGDQFNAPSARVRRVHRHAKAPRWLEADQLRQVIEAAGPAMRAKVLLAVNCGFGNGDLAGLRDADLGRRPGWVELPRHKTGIARRCPLWPETEEAIKAARAARPAPAVPSDADRVFLSKYGRPLVYESPGAGGKPGARVDSVRENWAALCKVAGVERPKGSGFYLLRHVFRTVAGGSLDERAVDLIMGHARSDMGDIYTARIGDERLEAVAEHVRAWIFGPATPAAPAAGKKKWKK